MKFTPHPVFRMITPTEAARMGLRRFQERMMERDRAIHLAETNPLEFGTEPEIYEVCDALLDFNWYPEGSGEWEAKRDLNAAYRKILGFERPVLALLINGGNQIGKTEYAIKRMTQLGLAKGKRDFWAFHSTETQSKQSHQPGFWKYLPDALKTENGIKSQEAYIAFKRKTGFSENSFILPNLSNFLFKTFSMDQDKAIQGPNVYGAWGDELIPLGWVLDLMFRVAKQDGFYLGTFTPVRGYNQVTAWFYEGADTVRWSTAFMLPLNGGEPDLARALGFHSREEYELAKIYGPNSRPEQTRNWLTGKPSQPEIPEGKAFERVPRVMRCAPIKFDGKWVVNRAVVFFHSCDGPHGRPANIVASAAARSTEEIKWRVYGFASKQMTALYRKFDAHHIIDDKDVPVEGTNYHLADPAGARNMAQLWLRVRGDDAYVYREWPGNYEIPGEGIPGEWALPDDTKADGRPGPGQQSFGWGLKRYKQEFARLEGWEDYKPDNLKDIADWDPANGARERVYERFLDSRAASNARVENDRQTTLLTLFEDLGVFFKLTPADDVEEGVQAVNDWLDWTPDENFMLARKRLHIARSCVNTITCMRMWTNQQGQKGACKDFPDLIRYAALLDLDEVREGDYATTLRDYG